MSRKGFSTYGEHKLHHLRMKPDEAKALKKNAHQHGPLTRSHDLNDEHRHSHIASSLPGAFEGGMPLDRLRVGEVCVLRFIGGEGALRRRLLDMGLTPGTRVTLRSVAPMGDPLELQLRGYSLSLRKEDAALIRADLSETQ